MRSTVESSMKWGAVLLGLFVPFALTSQVSLGQPYISTKGGLLNVVEGQADVHNAQERRWEKARPLLQLRIGDELRTRENSRAEMLLNPGTFVRLGADSAVRMVDNRLTELSLVLLSGSMELEAGNVKMIKQIQVSVQGRPFVIVKDGIYRFDVDESGLATARVFRGEMRVTAANGKTTKMKKSSMVRIDAQNGSLAFSHFDVHFIDNLSEWAALRSQQLAQANRGLSRSYSSSYYGGFYGYNPYLWGGGWFYNPFYGYYTYLPGFGPYYSPYGWYYNPPIIIYSGGGGGSYRSESSGRAHEPLNSGYGRGDKRPAPSYTSRGSYVTHAPAYTGGSSRSEGSSGRSAKSSDRH